MIISLPKRSQTLYMGEEGISLSISCPLNFQRNTRKFKKKKKNALSILARAKGLGLRRPAFSATADLARMRKSVTITTRRRCTFCRLRGKWAESPDDGDPNFAQGWGGWGSRAGAWGRDRIQWWDLERVWARWFRDPKDSVVQPGRVRHQVAPGRQLGTLAWVKHWGPRQPLLPKDLRVMSSLQALKNGMGFANVWKEPNAPSLGHKDKKKCDLKPFSHWPALPWL